MRFVSRQKYLTSLLLVSAILQGCASTSVDLMLGAPINSGGFIGHGPTGTIRVRQPLNERTWCEYEHVSYVFAGPPFGPSSEEDSLDQVGCGITFGGRGK